MTRFAARTIFAPVHPMKAIEFRRRYLTRPLLARVRRAMPSLSTTEREALEAGTVWWDADLFGGNPDWNKLLIIPAVELCADERRFLDGSVLQLCAMLDDWRVNTEWCDLPAEVWQYMRDEGFFGMIIPKAYGGLGFSANAQSEVIRTLSTRSLAAALRLGLDALVPALTVQINCGSGMQSIDSAFRAIQNGVDDVVLAGGAEALSHSPLVLRQEAVEWLSNLAAADGVLAKGDVLADMRPGFFKPVVALERGLTDPILKLNMGQTAELLAHLFSISREDADRYAVESHHRPARAQREGWFDDEVVPMATPGGTLFRHDDGVRPDTTEEALAGLQPVFERPFGKVTAGNSLQVTDGASWVLLASWNALRKYGWKPRAKILDSEWSALDPSIMGLGPVLASTALPRRQQMSREDVDLWELNEAFAAQVLACLAAWEDEGFCRKVLGLEGAFGRIDRDRLNQDGGGISLGYPVGTSGNRIVLHLVNALHRLEARTGIATKCIGGGQGGAMLIERS